MHKHLHLRLPFDGNARDEGCWVAWLALHEEDRGGIVSVETKNTMTGISVRAPKEETALVPPRRGNWSQTRTPDLEVTRQTRAKMSIWSPLCSCPEDLEDRVQYHQQSKRGLMFTGARTHQKNPAQAGGLPQQNLKSAAVRRHHRIPCQERRLSPQQLPLSHKAL